MEYLIGIECGGTKSELTAYDLNCNQIYKNVGGYGNPSVNKETTIKNICYLIDNCLSDLSGDKCVFIAIGMAGGDTGDFKNIIQKNIFDLYSIRNVVLNDAEMTAKAYLKDNDGIVAIAGTGTSIYVQKNHFGRLIGGWGHILDDKGSGYHTVIEAFRRITYQIDNKIQFDKLSVELLKEMHISGPSDIKKFIYSNDKRVIASLFPVIVALSEKGDEASISLLKNAAGYLAKTTQIAVNEFEKGSRILIGLKGGVFYNSRILLSCYEKEVNRYCSCSLIKEDLSVAKAVCNIYRTRRLQTL